MSKALYIGLGAGVAGGGLWAYDKYVTAERALNTATFGLPQNVKFDKQNWLFTLTVPLFMTNVRSTTVGLDNLDLDVSVNKSFVGRSFVANPISLNPNGQTMIPLSVTVSATDLISAVPTIVLGIQKPLIFTLNGFLKVALIFNVPINNLNIEFTALSDIIDFLKGSKTQAKTLSLAETKLPLTTLQTHFNELNPTHEVLALVA